MNDIKDRLAQIPEAAKALGVTNSTLRWWIQIGKIDSRKPGKRRLIPVSEINRIIEGKAQDQVQRLATAA